MTPPRRSRRRGPIVLVFGEDPNDAESIVELLVAANPRLERRVFARRRPATLARGAKPSAVRDWVQEIAAVVRAERATGTQIGAVVVHRDADCHDPDGAVEAELRSQLKPLDGLPAVPVQQIEAWWLLFPDATEAVRPIAWRGKLPRQGRDVERIVDPKAELKRLTRRGGSDEYSESESLAIARKIREMAPTRHGRSASYDRLTTMAESLR